jgi:hypothetical protein
MVFLSDSEMIAAVRPRLATPGGLLIIASPPYARRVFCGELQT